MPVRHVDVSLIRVQVIIRDTISNDHAFQVWLVNTGVAHMNLVIVMDLIYKEWNIYPGV
jgi:hypothetical protein